MLKIEAGFVELLTARTVLDVFRAQPARRRSRRQRVQGLGLAQVGTVASISGVKTKHTISGQLTGTPAVAGDAAPTVDITREISNTVWTFAATGADSMDTYFSVIFTAVKNATTTLDLTGVLTAFNGDLLATLTIIRKITFEYLTFAQDAVNGSNTLAVTPVTIQPSAANPWINSPLGAAQIYTMKPGGKWDVEDHSTAGMVVTAGTGDKLDFIHGVNNYDAKFRITIFGNK